MFVDYLKTGRTDMYSMLIYFYDYTKGGIIS